MQYTHVIIHFGEVILKGANRRTLEKGLIKDIRQRLSAYGLTTSTQHGYGRLVLSLPDTSEKTRESLHQILSRVPGIANFAFAVHVAPDIERIKEVGQEMAQKYSFHSFKVSTRRPDKTFLLTSQEVNEQVGAYIGKATNARVQLTNPEWVLHIAITEFGVFLFPEKHPGMGGLPIGTSGHGLALFSGGIDSPVAAYLMMKRGMSLSVIHFHSLPKTSPESIEKVRTLLKTLTHIQPNITLHLVPLLTIQKRIAEACPEDISLILQRRFMMRIAQNVAEREQARAPTPIPLTHTEQLKKDSEKHTGAGGNKEYGGIGVSSRSERGRALITGESLGQVASQTIQNMHAIESAAQNIPVLRPLVGFDKQEIMDRAYSIGTYETSILPHEDCCTAFLPDRPKTKAHVPSIEKAERNLNIDALVDDAITQMETEVISLNP